MIVFQDKLGEETIFMNVNLIAVSMENNVFCAWHYVCKCLYWRTSMRVPNFMLVSKSAQFTWNLELSRRTKKRIKVKTMSENIAGACVCNMRIEFNLRRNVQLYSFRMF